MRRRAGAVRRRVRVWLHLIREGGPGGEGTRPRRGPGSRPPGTAHHGRRRADTAERRRARGTGLPEQRVKQNSRMVQANPQRRPTPGSRPLPPPTPSLPMPCSRKQHRPVRSMAPLSAPPGATGVDPPGAQREDIHLPRRDSSHSVPPGMWFSLVLGYVAESGATPALWAREARSGRSDPGGTGRRCVQHTQRAQFTPDLSARAQAQPSAVTDGWIGIGGSMSWTSTGAHDSARGPAGTPRHRCTARPGAAR